jgi:hypothetical protein
VKRSGEEAEGPAGKRVKREGEDEDEEEMEIEMDEEDEEEDGDEDGESGSELRGVEWPVPCDILRPAIGRRSSCNGVVVQTPR